MCSIADGHKVSDMSKKESDVPFFKKMQNSLFPHDSPLNNVCHGQDAS